MFKGSSKEPDVFVHYIPPELGFLLILSGMYYLLNQLSIYAYTALFSKPHRFLDHKFAIGDQLALARIAGMLAPKYKSGISQTRR